MIFRDESKGYEGIRALKELDAEASLSLYGTAVIAKDAAGKVSVKQTAGAGPLGTAVGGLVGGLVGLLGGPVGAVVGASSGMLIGSWSDLLNLGVSAEFLDEVSQKLLPGVTAVVAEVEEYWMAPLDTRMAAIGGIILREDRADVEDEQHQRKVNARRAELAQLKSEFALARDEHRTRMKERIDTAQAKLQDTSARAQAWIDQRRQATEAKIEALKQQAAKAKGDAKAKIDQQIAELRADFDRRSTKVKQATEQTNEAIAA